MTAWREVSLQAGVWQALATVVDPEFPVCDIVELGLILDVTVTATGVARITMTLTAPNCPVAESLPAQVREAVAAVPGITGVEITLSWDPPWTPEAASPLVRLYLELA